MHDIHTRITSIPLTALGLSKEQSTELEVSQQMTKLGTEEEVGMSITLIHCVHTYMYIRPLSHSLIINITTLYVGTEKITRSLSHLSFTSSGIKI